MPKPTARNVVNSATGNAARFNQVVAEYAKAPAVTRDRMYIDTMQQIFSSTSKVMIDAKTANQIYLPLDRMLAQSAANEAAIGSRSGPVMPPPQGAAGRSRTRRSQPQRTSRRPQGQQQQPQQQHQPQRRPRPRRQPRTAGDSARKIDPRSRESSREQGEPLMSRLISIADRRGLVLCCCPRACSWSTSTAMPSSMRSASCAK